MKTIQIDLKHVLAITTTLSKVGATLQLNGEELIVDGISDDEMNAALDAVDLEQLTADLEAVDSHKKQIVKIREVIAENVGDTESLLGTVADASGVLVAVALSDIVALSTATDFAKYKKARLDALKELSGDADIVAIAGEALGKIKSGEVILTASLKGLEETIAETLERSTGVVQVMIDEIKEN